MRRWSFGIVFFLAVLSAGVILRVTDYGMNPSPSTTVISADATVTTSPSAAEATTSSSEPVVIPSLEPGVDDALVLEQPEVPRIPGIDYEAFPTGADPSDPAGTVYHVSVVGDDEAAGSESLPFATIDRALATAVDGDTVLVHAGSYATRGLTVTQSRFLLTAAGDGDVTVESAAPGADYGLAVSSPGQHDVVVRGLRLVGFDRLGIRYGNPSTVHRVALDEIVVEGSRVGMAGYFDVRGPVIDGLLVRHLTVEGASHSGLRFGEGGGLNVRLVGVHVSGAAAGDGRADVTEVTEAGGVGSAGPVPTVPESDDPVGIVVQQGDNFVVEGSIIEGVGGDGLDIAATRAAVVSTIVRHTAGSGVRLRAGGDLVNLLVFDTGSGAQVMADSGEYRVVGCTFAYHTSGGAEPFAAAFGLGAEAGPVDVSVTNCVFYQQPGPLHFPGRASVRFEHNVFWGFPGVLVDWGVRQWGSEDVAALGEGNLALDPLLADPERGDFHPGVGSPLFAAGVGGDGVPSLDLLGLPRVESITAGAFQTTRGGVSHTPATTTTTGPVGDATTTSTGG